MKGKYLGWIILIVFLAEYSILAVPRVSNGVSHCDTYGYLNLARLIELKGFLNTSQKDENISQFVEYAVQKGIKLSEENIQFIFSPHAHYNDRKGQVYNQYPPGYPFLLAYFSKIFGEDSVFYLNLVCLIVFSIFIYILLASFFGPLLRVLIVIFLVSIKTIFCHSLVIMSDNISLFFILTAYLLWLVKKQPILIFISGLMLGFSFLIRTVNILALVPLAILQIISREKKAIFFYMGYLISILILMVYIYSIYGTPFRSTYTYLDTKAFHWPYFQQNVVYYCNLIQGRFFKIGPFLGSGGLILGLFRPKLRRLSGLCLGIITVYFVSGCFFRHQYERYIFPVYCGLTLGLGVFLEIGLRTLFLKRWPKLLSKIFTIFLLFLICHQMITLPGRVKKYCGARIDFPRLEKIAGLVHPKGIIWCEDISSEIRFYNRQLTYRVNWGKPEIVMLAVQYFIENHIPQYFIPDTQNAQKAIEQIKEKFKLKIIDSEIPIYKL